MRGHLRIVGGIHRNDAYHSLEDRARYLAALDRASIHLDIAPFAAFLAACVRRSTSAAARAARQAPT